LPGFFEERESLQGTKKVLEEGRSVVRRKGKRELLFLKKKGRCKGKSVIKSRGANLPGKGTLSHIKQGAYLEVWTIRAKPRRSRLDLRGFGAVFRHCFPRLFHPPLLWAIFTTMRDPNSRLKLATAKKHKKKSNFAISTKKKKKKRQRPFDKKTLAD